jgi:hypothetical protein
VSGISQDVAELALYVGFVRLRRRQVRQRRQVEVEGRMGLTQLPIKHCCLLHTDVVSSDYGEL